MKKVKTSYKGRICKFPHCKHILSIYNHEAYCHIHLSQIGLSKSINQRFLNHDDA